MNAWTLVEDPHTLSQAKEAVRAAATLAIDTEYDSFRYFRDKLCLIQVQTGDRTWLIDPFCGLDLAFLGEVVESEAVLKIFHAGDNDIRILKRDYGFSFRNIFDTHRAAHLLGHRQLALGRLIEAYLGITLAKTQQRSRWDLRPLKEEQLAYAALDTAYLPVLYERLAAELKQRGLEKRASEVFAAMTEVSWQPKTLDQHGHRQIAGSGLLSEGQKERLRRLFSWRFEKARTRDRACFLILTDRQLMDLARLEQVSLETLSSVLPPEKIRLYGAEVLAILEEKSDAFKARGKGGGQGG